MDGASANPEPLDEDQHIRELPPEPRLKLLGLPAREAELALLYARGMRTAEIGEHCNISRGTVSTLLTRACGRLGCADRCSRFERRG